MATSLNYQSFMPAVHFVRPLPFKAHKIDCFSPEMLEQHYEEVYGGAVRRLNGIEREITTNSGDAALRAEQFCVANSVVLHEIYFGSIGEEGGEALSDATLRQAIGSSFGSIANWRVDFSSLAMSADGGWVILAWSDRFGRLMDIHIAADAQALCGAAPVLVLDMEEHAYSADFKSNREAYIRAFIESVHWVRVAERFQIAQGAGCDAGDDANQISVAALKGRLDKGEDVLILDVRHDDDRARYKSRIMETEWRDSFDVAGWAKDLPKDKPIVVYCMYGFWVSQKAAQELRDLGFDARSLLGGVTAWRAMGYPSTDNVY